MSLFHRVLACSTILLGTVAYPMVAQLTTGPQLLVTPQVAAKMLTDSKTVFLQVGEKASYDKEHVPGARFVTLDAISAPKSPGGLSLEMPPEDSLRNALQRLGISDDSRVVVMFSDEWGTPSTRVLFTLGYAGLSDRAVLMSGGVEAWKRAGLPLTAAVVTPKVGHITRNSIPSLIVDYQYVQKIWEMPHVKLVDGRDSVFFAGPTNGGMKKGHIPGAASFPYSTFTDDTMNIVSPTVIEQWFRSAGIMPGDTVVAYCHVGQQATMALFAARLAGHPVKLYDGSMDDWNKRSLPLDTLATPAKKGDVGGR